MVRLRMLTSFRRWGTRSWEDATVLNYANIEAAISDTGGKLLDLGCDDGERTMRFAAAAGASEIFGVEFIPERAAIARGRGIETVEQSLETPLPFEDGSFDVILSNQVIEHLFDTDTFVGEIRRLLKPGGVSVTSTENLASWHNIGALVMGWQPFSLTNVTAKRGGVGNPLAVTRADPPPRPGWQHHRVFAARGLVELFEAHGFERVQLLGAGYYPFSPKLGSRWPRHASFLTVVAS